MPDSYYEEFGAHYAHMKKLFTDGLKNIGIPFLKASSRTLASNPKAGGTRGT